MSVITDTDAEHFAKLNKAFPSGERVQILSEARQEMEEVGAGTITVCQGEGYCTQSKEFIDSMYDEKNENPPECHWCGVIGIGDKRKTAVILREMVRIRTTGRH